MDGRLVNPSPRMPAAVAKTIKRNLRLQRTSQPVISSAPIVIGTGHLCRFQLLMRLFRITRSGVAARECRAASLNPARPPPSRGRYWPLCDGSGGQTVSFITYPNLFCEFMDKRDHVHSDIGKWAYQRNAARLNRHFSRGQRFIVASFNRGASSIGTGGAGAQIAPFGNSKNRPAGHPRMDLSRRPWQWKGQTSVPRRERSAPSDRPCALPSPPGFGMDLVPGHHNPGTKSARRLLHR